MKRPDDKSFFNPNKELTEAIRALHKFLAATLGAASKRDWEKGLKQLKDDLVKEMGERVDPARIRKLTNNLKTNAQALEKAATENQSK